MLTIPFEALDVQFKNPISLELDDIFNKVVVKNRGGYCYELNYLFYSLLTEIGFNCNMIYSQIFDEGIFGPEFGHMCMTVKLEETWLVDVGYGDLFIEPIKIIPDLVQEDQFKNYRIELISQDKYLLSSSVKDKSDFQQRYLFNTLSREIKDFEDQNKFNQNSPESYFAKNTICTISTLNGRKTIKNNTYKHKTDDQVVETNIKDKNELLNLLKREFNIDLLSQPS